MHLFLVEINEVINCGTNAFYSVFENIFDSFGNDIRPLRLQVF